MKLFLSSLLIVMSVMANAQNVKFHKEMESFKSQFAEIEKGFEKAEKYAKKAAKGDEAERMQQNCGRSASAFKKMLVRVKSASKYIKKASAEAKSYGCDGTVVLLEELDDMMKELKKEVNKGAKDIQAGEEVSKAKKIAKIAKAAQKDLDDIASQIKAVNKKFEETDKSCT